MRIRSLYEPAKTTFADHTLTTSFGLDSVSRRVVSANDSMSVTVDRRDSLHRKTADLDSPAMASSGLNHFMGEQVGAYASIHISQPI
ncbi:MAG: hypothetical protein QGH20_02315 [Candidatus Latescibacteria bacterium]|nr:hypothetical protein [Candidatus Latescibacterota bacterium]